MEVIFTKFVSLISAEPTVQTLLPLTPQASFIPPYLWLFEHAGAAESCGVVLHASLLHGLFCGVSLQWSGLCPLCWLLPCSIGCAPLSCHHARLRSAQSSAYISPLLAPA